MRTALGSSFEFGDSSPNVNAAVHYNRRFPFVSALVPGVNVRHLRLHDPQTSSSPALGDSSPNVFLHLAHYDTSFDSAGTLADRLQQLMAPRIVALNQQGSRGRPGPAQQTEGG